MHRYVHSLAMKRKTHTHRVNIKAHFFAHTVSALSWQDVCIWCYRTPAVAAAIIISRESINNNNNKNFFGNILSVRSKNAFCSRFLFRAKHVHETSQIGHIVAYCNTSSICVLNEYVATNIGFFVAKIAVAYFINNIEQQEIWRLYVSSFILQNNICTIDEMFHFEIV